MASRRSPCRRRPPESSRLIDGVPGAKLHKRPAPDQWSVSEILAHLADGEIVGGFRMRVILGDPRHAHRGLRPGWLGDERPLRQTRSADSLEQFRVLREGNLALLESLDRAVEALRGAFRTRRGIDRTHRAHVRRTRHQPSATSRKDPRASQLNQNAAMQECNNAGRQQRPTARVGRLVVGVLRSE